MTSPITWNSDGLDAAAGAATGAPHDPQKRAPA
jgi:hypothetical protein